jgi:ABC-type uncharacterized transport system ATPase subunit
LNNSNNSAETPLLELTGISKSFPGCLANDNVDLTIAPGEIHALLGENGAGKSTLVKIIYGILKPDTGTLKWNGESVSISNPSAARNLGVAMVFQHFSLFEALTVVENILLGMEGEHSLDQLAEQIIEVSNSYGLPLDPHRHVHTLSVGERQRIEIVRCLLQQPKLLIMDEPTSVLTPQEVEKLFVTLRRLAEEGLSILYISHKLEEIRALCHNATILRLGRRVAEADPTQETARSLAALMMGEELQSAATPPAIGTKSTCRLSVNNLTMQSGDEFGVDLNGISLQVHSGEIVGIAGVAGNGQNELMDALSGEQTSPTATDIQLDGEPCGQLGAESRRSLGLGCVPEQRLGHAAVPDMSLAENAFLTGHHHLGMTRNGFVQFESRDQFASKVIDEYNVKCTGGAAAATSLSGGNLQKFIVGREILQNPGVLVVSQPTWGVDAGAAGDIQQALIQLAENGSAVLVISQDLDELMQISNRISAICAGSLSETCPTSEITIEKIGLLMGGVHTSEAQHAEA